MNAAKYNAFRKRVLDAALGITPLVAPANIKIRLFTVAPTAAGGDGTPVAGNGYSDQTIAWNGSVVPAASGSGVATLAAQINFGFASGGAWGTIVAVDIRDAATDALMWWATLDTPLTIADAQGFVFNAGDLVWTES